MKRIIIVPAEKKKTINYQAWILFGNISPLLLLVISAVVAKSIVTTNKDTDYYAQHLKIIGEVTPGVHIFRVPRFRYPISSMLIEVFPITLIGFMESYSIAKTIAVNKGI